MKIAVEQTAHPLEISPLVTGYAVAVPAGLFVLLLWAVYRPIVARPVLRPAVTLGGVAAILVAPLGARLVGVPAVVAVIALVAVLLIVSTLCRPFRIRLSLKPRDDRVARTVDEAERGPDLATAIAHDDNSVSGEHRI